MTEEIQSTAFRLLEAGAAAPFRVIRHEVLPSPDEAEFGIRLEFQIAVEADSDNSGELEDILEWGAFGFVFVLAQLAFADARPRAASAAKTGHIARTFNK